MDARIALHDLRSLLRRINGLSLWGAQWTNGADPRQEIKALFDELAQRRVLFAPHSWEVPHETITSVLEIRRYVVEAMKKLRSGSDTHKLLGVMASACLAYLDKRDIEHDRFALETALTELRIVFGACLLVLSDNYALSLEGPIARILPQNVDVDELRSAMADATSRGRR